MERDPAKHGWHILESASFRPNNGGPIRGGNVVSVAMQQVLHARISSLRPRWTTRADAVNNLLASFAPGPLPQQQNVVCMAPVAVPGAYLYLHYPPTPKIERAVFTDSVAARADVNLPTRALGVRQYCRGALQAWNMRRIAGVVKGVMINSRWGEGEMGAARKKTQVVYPPCKLGRAKRGTRQVDVITIGAIVPNKRHHTALEICARSRLAKNVDIIGMTHYSERHYHKALIRLCEKHGAGLRKDISEAEKRILMQNARCVIAPCRLEPFGIGVVEAISEGCIPIVYDGYGFRETVPFKELRFSDIDEAASITDDALSGKFDHLLPKLQRHQEQFSLERFRSAVRDLLRVDFG